MGPLDDNAHSELVKEDPEKQELWGFCLALSEMCNEPNKEGVAANFLEFVADYRGFHTMTLSLL